MTVTEAEPWELTAAAEDVADSAPAARWSVAETGWKELLPELPEEVIALLAPPVVVSAHSIDTGSVDARGALEPHCEQRAAGKRPARRRPSRS